jgi:hypothetical protein
MWEVLESTPKCVDIKKKSCHEKEESSMHYKSLMDHLGLKYNISTCLTQAQRIKLRSVHRPILVGHEKTLRALIWLIAIGCDDPEVFEIIGGGEGGYQSPTRTEKKRHSSIYQSMHSKPGNTTMYACFKKTERCFNPCYFSI